MGHADEKTRQRAKELRKNQTPAEAVLWTRLRDRRLNGLKFRRQHPIGPFIADFYFAQGRLVIEVDGSVHLQQEQYDASRTLWLNDHSYRMVRFTNDEVKQQLDAVLQAILRVCEGKKKQRRDVPALPRAEKYFLLGLKVSC